MDFIDHKTGWTYISRLTDSSSLTDGMVQY